MNLPANPPILPMLAKRIETLPLDPNLIYEPKWDGFRTLIFRDRDELLIQSRDGKPLNRYFPDLVAALPPALPQRCVLDGEIVIARGGALDFDALQLRLHPAASRAKLLAQQTPAAVVFFDLLALDDRDLCPEPFHVRRAELERILAGAAPPIHLTPATRDPETAADWFRRFEGAGLDGVIAKPADGTYQPDKRVMLKVKHERDCDCVVTGFRWYKDSNQTAVGSLLLSLYNDAGDLQQVGVCASFTADKRRELVEFLEPYRAHTTMQGEQSRWSQGKDTSWELLRPELVVEVAYEHMQGPRFRHMAHFRRWRPDKSPRDCTYAQLEVVPPHELSTIFQ